MKIYVWLVSFFGGWRERIDFEERRERSGAKLSRQADGTSIRIGWVCRMPEPVSSTSTHGASSRLRHAWKSFTPRSYLAPSYKRATLRPTRSNRTATTKSDTSRGRETGSIGAKEKSTVYCQADEPSGRGSRVGRIEICRWTIRISFPSLGCRAPPRPFLPISLIRISLIAPAFYR